MCSRGVPSGISTITWNSLLLSNGSILTVTSLSGTSATDARSRKETPARNASRDTAVPNEAGHRAAIQPRGRALWRVAVSAPGPKQAGGGPGGDHEGGRQRKQHRRGRAHWNWPHVGAHQPADERHRQNRGDDGEGRENRRIADLIDGADRNRDEA